jgi:ABC-2 type transport system permease protein
VDSAQPRSDHAAFHRCAAGDAALPVWQRHQHQSEESADREAEAERALTQGEVLFVITFPPDFDRAVDRGEQPSVLIDADATDPSAICNATALASIATVLDRDLPPTLRATPTSSAFQFVVHARYNPEQLTVLNVVPGLVCIVLMMSTLFMTTLSITRERERGTMENLLAMPARPIEVMLAKMVPYVFIGYVQVLLLLVASAVFFRLPLRGSLVTLMLALGLFIGSNLALGITFSTVSSNQMQATQFAVRAPALVHVVGVHVPVQRHAALGPMDRRGLPDHPCHAHCARRADQGQRQPRHSA